MQKKGIDKDKNTTKEKDGNNNNSYNQGGTKNVHSAMVGVLIALAMLLSYLEGLVPLSFTIPGIKLGLANIVTIYALYKISVKSAITIGVGRVILSGILFGNLYVIIYSLAGTLLSITVMAFLRRIKKVSIAGVSIAGAVFHNFGQILVAMLLMENARIAYYMAVLLVSGTIAGIVIGIIAGMLIKTIK